MLESSQDRKRRATDGARDSLSARKRRCLEIERDIVAKPSGLEIPSPLRQSSTESPSVSTRFVRETPGPNNQPTIIAVEREFEGFLLPHESPGDADDLEHKPIRYMRYFRILRLTDPDKFELAEKENYTSLMNFEEGCEIGPLYVFGFARIKSDDDSESETEVTAVNEEVPLLSSVIMRSWWSRDPNTVVPGVWLETQYAYYILEGPHPDYQEYYTKFDSWVQTTHRLVDLARTTPNLALDDILKELNLQGHAGSDEHFTEDEMRDTVKRVLLDVDPDGYETPFKAGDPWDDRVHDMEHLWHTPAFKRMRKWTQRNPYKVQQPLRAADPSTPTFATPLIDGIAGPLFESLAKGRQFKATRMPNWSDLSCPCVYSKYKAGSFILYERDKEILPSVIVKVVRPGVIIEFSNLNGVRLAHVLRLEHASCTPMGELAHPKELVLVPHCDDVNMDKLRGLLAVESISSAIEPPKRGTSFFVRYLYDFIEDHALLDLDPLWDSKRTCLACSYSSKSRRRTHDSELWHHFSNEVPSLAAFDAFSGAGGVSTGLVKSGAVACKYAVEIEESAAHTFQTNHPEAVVWPLCMNAVTRHADSDQRKDSIQTLRCGEQPFPSPGAIDIQVGGSPCQGVSTLNRQRFTDDPKNRLILSFLSMIDIQRPRYVIYENVRGFVRFDLAARGADDGPQSTEGLASGLLKILYRCLVAMGYQVRAGILQAANYGVPQTRRRFILLASQRGVILPRFPLPSHASPFGELHLLLLPIGLRSDRLPRRLRHLPEQMHVSVSEAIGDLPQWEWEISNDDPATDGPTQWPWDKLSSNKELSVVLGPPETLEYMGHPLTDYQRSMRRGSSGVTFHFTPEFSELQVRRVLAVKMAPDADYKTIEDPALRPNDEVESDYDGHYKRLNADGLFQTILTKLSPRSECPQVLHYSLNRVITVRELARAQGFPDDYQFYSKDKDVRDVIRQIGNAVPPPLAAAIGREIRKAQFEQWVLDRESEKYRE